MNLSGDLVLDGNGIWVGSSPDSLPVSYPEHGNELCFQVEDSSFWFRHRNECIASIVNQFPPDGLILDVGGGNGYVARSLIDRGHEVVLLEPGPVGALNAKKERKLPAVICATLESAHLRHGSLGAVGLFDVMEHIRDDRAFLDQVHSVLKPNGLLYATVPALQRLWSASDISAGHYRRYNRRILDDLLRGDFEILFFTYFFASLVLPIFLFRALPFSLSLGKKRKLVASQSEHTVGGPTARIIDALLKNELDRISQGKGSPIGASCLLVAQKKESATQHLR